MQRLLNTFGWYSGKQVNDFVDEAVVGLHRALDARDASIAELQKIVAGYATPKKRGRPRKVTT